MRSGMLRHRVTLQRFQQGQDAYGGPVETWEDVAIVWASLEAMSGREYFASQQTQ